MRAPTPRCAGAARAPLGQRFAKNEVADPEIADRAAAGVGSGSRAHVQFNLNPLALLAQALTADEARQRTLVGRGLSWQVREREVITA